MNTDKNNFINKITEANKAYIDGNPIMTDEEYDKLMEYGASKGWVVEDSRINDGLNTEDGEVYHSIPMLSLEKAKTKEDIERYFKYIKKFNKSTGFIVEPKLDGIAISIVYTHNKISQISTRGNGRYGQDITYILDNNELELIGIPNTISPFDQERVEVRGELYCTKSALIYNNENRKQINEKPFPNERSAVVGIVKKAKQGLGCKTRLQFSPYFIYSNNELIEYNPIVYRDFIHARSLFPKESVNTVTQLEELIKKADVWRKTLDAPTDGIVIKPSALVKTGEVTEHHPKEYIAFKYPTPKKATKVLEVNFSIGKTGKLTPVATVEPVTIDGVTIQNITCHNINWLREKSIKIGSMVNVTRSNDVIPMISEVVVNDENTKEIEIPKTCPCCGAPLKRTDKDLVCTNSSCSGILEYKMLTYVSKNYLDIDGLSQAVISVLQPQSLSELLSINLSELNSLEYESGVSLGGTRAKTIYENIQQAKENTPQEVWFTMLGFDNIGKATARNILKGFKSIDDFFENISLARLNNIQGIGNTMAKHIMDNKEKARKTWKSIRDKITIIPLKFDDDVVTFCITGNIDDKFENRNEAVKYIESKGAFKFNSSVTREVQYLITENIESKSSKLIKAKKLGIELINMKDFLNKFKI